MTIDKAIQNLEFHIRLGELVHHIDDITAINLSIEVLKRLKEGRRKGYVFCELLLKGETPE